MPQTLARVPTAERDLPAHIRAVVAAAPPLTTDQRDRLSILLRGAPSA